MKKIFFTVGPSQLYPTVHKHVREALRQHIPSISHRSSSFKSIYKQTEEALRNVLAIPSSHHIFFTSSALEAMERAIQGTVHTHSFHFVNGSFSKTFYQIAVDLQKQAKSYVVENGEGFDFASVTIPQETELVTIVQNETSTGVRIPMDSIYTLKKRYPTKLFAIDVVSSIPYVQIDFSLIDIALFSVQKGFGLPAGLGVLIVSDAALAKTKKLADTSVGIGSYHSLLKLHEFAEKMQTRETPNVMNIYLLGKVAHDMHVHGMDVLRQETEKKATLLYDFFDYTAAYHPFVKKPFRSETTIVIDVNGVSAEILAMLAAQGYVLSSGYGKHKADHIRIANFPAQPITAMQNLLHVLRS